MTDLRRDQLQRYGRHIVLPDVGIEGQKRLLNSRVLVIGAGGLGSPSALYLAAAGVGTIGLVDFDVVDATNLQRQILHTTSSVGQSKVSSARERITALNPDVQVVLHQARLSRENAIEILRDYDVILDGTDNFPTRYLVNDACVFLKKPNVFGSIFRFEGQVSVFDARRGPCYRCLYREPPPADLVPNCAEGGVFGVLPGIVGTIQAAETIKLLLGIGDPLIGKLLLVDALTMEFRTLNLSKDPRCVVCGPSPSITELIDYEDWCGSKKEQTMSNNPVSDEISVGDLNDRLKAGEKIRLVDVREEFERSLASIGGDLISLRALPERLAELDPSQEVIVYCHTGRRSGRAVAFLRQQGFAGARNLTGGIDAWSRLIDPAVPRY